MTVSVGAHLAMMPLGVCVCCFFATGSNRGQLETPDWLPKLGFASKLDRPKPHCQKRVSGLKLPSIAAGDKKHAVPCRTESHSAMSVMSAGALNFGAADNRLTQDDVAALQPAQIYSQMSCKLGQMAFTYFACVARLWNALMSCKPRFQTLWYDADFRG